jgi:hypothetical protein
VGHPAIPLDRNAAAKRASGPLACGRPDYLTFNLSNACYLMSSLKKPYLSKAKLVLFELKITLHNKKLF